MSYDSVVSTFQIFKVALDHETFAAIVCFFFYANVLCEEIVKRIIIRAK